MRTRKSSHFLYCLVQTTYMRKRDKDYQMVLDKLTTAEPSEVGSILKEYFSLKRKKNKR